MNTALLEKIETKFSEKDFINFLKNQGINVNTNTKARGNYGFFVKNRIDLSKNAPQNRRLSILAHEYAHKIHFDIDKDNFNTGGCLKKLFNTENIDLIQQELIQVTNYVDKNSTLEGFLSQKQQLKSQINELEKIIKLEYPDFKRSYDFKPINTYFRKHKSTAKYLLKYDNIKINNSFLFIKKEEIFSIQNIDKDFPEIPESFRTYIKIKSVERKYRKVCKCTNNAGKYYNKPTELFARLVQGLFIDKNTIQLIAPFTYDRFYYLLNHDYYGYLKDLMCLARLN